MRALRGRRRDSRAPQDPLGPGFAPPQPAGGPRGPERARPVSREAIHQPRREWCLRTDDGQVDALLRRQLDQTIDVIRENVECPRRATVARSDDDVDAFSIQLPGKRVLAAAGPDHQNLHAVVPHGSGVFSGVRSPAGWTTSQFSGPTWVPPPPFMAPSWAHM